MNTDLNRLSAFHAGSLTTLATGECQFKVLPCLSGRIDALLARIALSARQVGNRGRGLIFVLCLLVCGTAVADSVWTSGGSLNVARMGHTATLLLNGKVLVAGGASNQALASAELYDPATNAWTFAASMATPRSGQTATLLPNGKVLIVGGDGSSTAEIYDPATNAWRSASQLKIPRVRHTATLLPDGKVLIVGGYNMTVPISPSSVLASAEIYDPASNTWMDAPPLMMGHIYHTSTLLPNGKVLVCGGFRDISRDFNLADTELYDPATQIWVTAGAPAVITHSHSSTLLLDGRVLVAGGATSSGDSARAELYDPETNTWTNTGSLTTARIGHTATRLSDGSVLVVGGHVGGSYPSDLNSAEMFDPVTNTWSMTTPLATSRVGHTATLLPNGKVLVAGGEYADPVSPGLATTELFEAGYAGVATRLAQFASRATVTPAQTVYGAFVLADPAKLFIVVRGPSLGTLGVSANPYPHPYLSLHDGSGQLVAASNQCTGSTADNAAVVSFYRDVRKQALSASDACLGYVTSTLPAGIYTFMIVPDASAQTSSGEVLFEVTPAQ